jgi:hypothetical protein
MRTERGDLTIEAPDSTCCTGTAFHQAVRQVLLQLEVLRVQLMIIKVEKSLLGWWREASEPENT